MPALSPVLLKALSVPALLFVPVEMFLVLLPVLFPVLSVPALLFVLVEMFLVLLPALLPVPLQVPLPAPFSVFFLLYVLQRGTASSLSSR